MRHDHIGNLRADRSNRIKGCLRTLKDHGNLSAANSLELSAAKITQGLTKIAYRPARNLGFGRQQAEDRIAGDGLSGSALPDDADNLRRSDLKGDIIERSDTPVRCHKLDRQAVDAQ